MIPRIASYGVLWYIFDRENFNWHAGAALATWFMTLVIQRAEYRDTQAVHAKLDELLHVETEARNALTNIDKKDPEDIEKHRKLERANDGAAGLLAPYRAGTLKPISASSGGSHRPRSRGCVKTVKVSRSSKAKRKNRLGWTVR